MGRLYAYNYVADSQVTLPHAVCDKTFTNPMKELHSNIVNPSEQYSLK